MNRGLKTLSLLSVVAFLAAPVLACDPPDVTLDVKKIEKKLASLEAKKAQLSAEIAQLKSQLVRVKSKKSNRVLGGLTAPKALFDSRINSFQVKPGAQGGLVIVEDGSGAFSLAAPQKKKDSKKKTKGKKQADFFYEVAPRAKKKGSNDDLEERIRRIVDEAVERALKDIRRQRRTSSSDDRTILFHQNQALPTLKKNIEMRLADLDQQIQAIEIEACDAVPAPPAPVQLSVPVVAATAPCDPPQVTGQWRATPIAPQPPVVQWKMNTPVPVPTTQAKNCCCCCCCCKSAQKTTAAPGVIRSARATLAPLPAPGPGVHRVEVIFTDEDGRVIRREVRTESGKSKKTSKKYDPTTCLPACEDTPVSAPKEACDVAAPCPAAGQKKRVVQ